jgi:hypothetical protein
METNPEPTNARLEFVMRLLMWSVVLVTCGVLLWMGDYIKERNIERRAGKTFDYVRQSIGKSKTGEERTAETKTTRRTNRSAAATSGVRRSAHRARRESPDPVVRPVLGPTDFQSRLPTPAPHTSGRH